MMFDCFWFLLWLENEIWVLLVLEFFEIFFWLIIKLDCFGGLLKFVDVC